MFFLNSECKILSPAKLSLKNQDQIRTFSNKRKLRFHGLQTCTAKNAKVLQAEGNGNLNLQEEIKSMKVEKYMKICKRLFFS